MEILLSLILRGGALRKGVRIVGKSVTRHHLSVGRQDWAARCRRLAWRRLKQWAPNHQGAWRLARIGPEEEAACRIRSWWWMTSRTWSAWWRSTSPSWGSR